MTKSPQSVAFRFTRAGNIEPNPTLLRQRASAALSSTPDGTTFITIREGAGLGHYVVVPGAGAGNLPVIELAKTVGARADESAPPDLSLTRAVAFLKHERGSIAGSNASVNAELQAVVDVAASSLRDGEWVAFSIRRPSRQETKRNKRWLDHRGTYTHHSLEVNAVVISMWSGADSVGSARGVLARIAGALPGFDLRTHAASISPIRDVAAFAVLAIAGVAATFAPVPHSGWGWVVAAVAAVAAVATWFGYLPSRTKSLRSRLATGAVPAPPHRHIPPARPRRQTVDKEGNPVEARDGDYPLHPSTFLVGAVTPMAIVAPHAGAESGAQTTQSRTAPPVLREPVGPLLGHSGDAPVYLSDADEWAGFMALGEAGSGKSALLQAMWGYDAARKTGALSRSGGPGQFHTMIAFDTKGDAASADEYVAWSRAAGDRVLRIDFSDETSPVGIELFPTSGSAMNRARRMVSALRYVFGEQSIGPESFATLSRVMVGAFAVTPEVASQVPGIEPNASPFYYANILLSSRGDDLGVQLAAAIRTKAERDGDTDAREATEMLAPIYDPQRTTAQRQALVKAPQNKLEQLIAAEHWWSRPKRATWKSLLEHNTSVVVNFGVANGFMADAALTEQVAALMMFTLHEEIQRNCAGWFEQGKQVSVYADELKHIAGTNAQVVSWIRNDARSFGARGVFATQFPQQLEPEVRSTVMGFGTLVAFAQRDPRVISEVLASLSVDGSEWAASDLAGLPRFEAIVRTTFRGTGQTPFTVRIPDFRSMRGVQFIAAQGQQDATAMSAPVSWDEPSAPISFATVQRQEPAP